MIDFPQKFTKELEIALSRNPGVNLLKVIFGAASIKHASRSYPLTNEDWYKTMRDYNERRDKDGT